MQYDHSTCMHACMHACSMITVYACIMIIVRACTMIIVIACTMIIVCVSCPTGLLFGVIQIGASRGKAPGKAGGLVRMMGEVGSIDFGGWSRLC